MDQWKAFNEQLAVTKQMVEELKKINNVLGEIKLTLKQKSDDSNFNISDFLGEILGGFDLGSINGTDLANELEDDDDIWGEDQEEDDQQDLDYLEELAEEDIEDILASNHLPTKVYGKTVHLYNSGINYNDVVFEVDYDKETVKAYLYMGDLIIKESIAKCDLADEFIEATGKAIALRRLFDLEVPEELLQH